MVGNNNKMETKVKKLKSLLNDAKNKNETILLDFYSLAYDKLKRINDSEFNAILIEFMFERAEYATINLKKKNTSIVDKEIYCLSLLSYIFLDAKYKPYIEGKKVKIDDD